MAWNVGVGACWWLAWAIACSEPRLLCMAPWGAGFGLVLVGPVGSLVVGAVVVLVAGILGALVVSRVSELPCWWRALVITPPCLDRRRRP